MPYTFQVAFDCHDPHALADWWADALGWEVQPISKEFIEQMIAEGYASEDDTTTHRGHLVWKTGAAIKHPHSRDDTPRVLFQQVPENKTTKNRVHLDIRVGDEDVETIVRRLREAGATHLHDGQQGPHTWVTLADPEGNEFCVSR
jgi:hypothetical protein